MPPKPLVVMHLRMREGAFTCYYRPVPPPPPPQLKTLHGMSLCIHFVSNPILSTAET